jgi:hypothetical protein
MKILASALSLLVTLMLASCQSAKNISHRHATPTEPSPETPPPDDPKPLPGTNAPAPPGPMPEPREVFFDYKADRDLADLVTAKARPKFPSVSQQTLLAAFDKKRPDHPRILLQKDDIARIKKLRADKDPYVLASIQALRRQADGALAKNLLSDALDESNLRMKAPHDTQKDLAVLGLLYLLTNETRYSDKVKQILLHYAAFPHWNDRKHFLDTGIMSYSVAMAYDWIYPEWSAKEKLIIEQALMSKGLQAGLDRIAENPFWYLSKANWNPICNGGLGIAALAIFDSSPEARKLAGRVLEKALYALPFYVREFEPDGQSTEGIMYWDYGLSNFIRFSETLKRVLGTDYGLTNTQGLREAGYFPFRTSGPVTGISIGDDPLKVRRSSANFWWAYRYQDSNLARLHQQQVQDYQPYDWFDLIFYRPELVAQGNTPDASLDSYVRDLDYVSFRSSWNHAQALYAGIHAGDNTASHGHLDAGSFFVQGMGRVWAIGGLGNDAYTIPGYFKMPSKPDYMDPLSKISEPSRFHLYRLRGEGKNVLVFNPDARPDQNPQGKALVQRIRSDADSALAIVDLSKIYSRDVLHYRRGLALRNKRSTVWVRDEFSCRKSSDVYWFMHTIGSLELKNEGRTALIHQGAQSLRVQILTPSHAKFEIMKAESLPQLPFPRNLQSANTLFQMPIQKLTIHLANVREESITVVMGLTEGSDGEFDRLSADPLSSWEH